MIGQRWNRQDRCQQHQRADTGKQQRCSPIGDRSGIARNRAAQRQRADRHDQRRQRSCQHAPPGQARAVRPGAAQSRRQREIGDINQAVTGAKQQMPGQNPGKHRDAVRRCGIGHDKAQPQRHCSGSNHCAITRRSQVPVGPHPDHQAGHAIPRHGNRITRSRLRDRQAQRFGVIKQQVKHHALPVEIEGKIARGIDQQAPPHDRRRGHPGGCVMGRPVGGPDRTFKAKVRHGPCLTDRNDLSRFFVVTAYPIR